MDNFIKKLDAVFIEGIMHPLIIREYSEDIISFLEENNLMEDFDENDSIEDYENNDLNENDLQVLLEYEYSEGTKWILNFYEDYHLLNYEKFLGEFIDKLGVKGIIFGMGLLKLLNEALKHLNEEEFNILYDGINFEYAHDFFGNEFFEIANTFSKYGKFSENTFKLEDLSGFSPIYDYNEKWFGEDSEKIHYFLEPEKDMDKLLYIFIFSFNDKIAEIFDKIKFLDFISMLEQKSLLNNVIIGLNWIDFPSKYFNSLETFVNTVNNFIDILCDYDFGENLLYLSANYGKEQLYREKDALRDENLVELLFTNIDLKKYDKINIYDPCCDNVNLINKTLKFIKLNYNYEVNYYGKLNFNYSYFDTTKVIFYSLLNENVFLSSIKNKEFPFDNPTLDEIDFIISDSRGKNIDEDHEIFLNHFINKLDTSSKVVILLNKGSFGNYFTTSTILNDNLESIITFNDCYILILNSDKLIDKKNRFLLVDYTLLDKEYVNSMETIKNEEKEMQELGFRDPKSHYIKKSLVDSMQMKNVIDVYANFKNTDFSKVINNDEVNSFQYGFIYNHLIYDLKRKPYSIVKQKSIGNKQSKIIEEKLEFVPLYSLITFDEDEIDDNSDVYKIIKFNREFYVKSEKILRKFLLYYLNSDMGKEEHNYFKDSFGFSHAKGALFYSDYNTINEFICMRIPLVDIETQKKIIDAYELNEEHYKLVKESRDNFRKNILDYEKVLKDMEEFNKMEIDINTGKIIEMNTVKRHMFDGLLWPLSISYLNAVHGTHVSNPNEKLDFYLKLFEFITAFIDIILISAIPKEEYDNLKHELWKDIVNNNSYKVTFGTWTVLYSRLLEAYSEQDIYPKFNNELIESLSNKDIEAIMNEVREMRNEFPAHGVKIPESRAKQLIDDLKLKINVVYDIFGYLTGFKLFHSVKVLELLDDGRNKYEVISLNGPCDQPIYGEVTFNERLKNNSLYLNNSLDGDLLELNQYLILFEETVEEYKDKHGNKKERATGRFNLYLFNGYRKKKNKYQIRYKCYQIETDEVRKNMSFEEWDEYFY